MQSLYVTLYSFMAVFSLCFQNICYALRFRLRMHSIQLMWAKWRMSFHVAREKRKKRTSPVCHKAWPLWSERLSSTVCMESFIWVVVFHFLLGTSCTFCSAFTVWCVVVQYYAQHSCMWIIISFKIDSSPISSLPLFSAVAVNVSLFFPHVHLAWGKDCTIFVLCHFKSTVHFSGGRVIQLYSHGGRWKRRESSHDASFKFGLHNWFL